VSTPGPATGSARAGRSALRAAVAVLSVLTVLATVVSAVGWAGLTHLSSNIGVVDVDQDLGTARPTKATPTAPTTYEPLNILVMGTDTRTGQGSGFGDASNTASGEGHSDTAILLHVSGDRTRALGVSLPRDSWVTRPSCKGGGTVTGKFNAAFATGGPACTIKAVESLTGVRIDHFVVVNFLGFEAVVDALGGVPICTTVPIDDPKSHLKLKAGTTVLNGQQALAFARARKTLGDGSDISRIDRQQVFLSSVVRTATEAGLLTNPVKLFSVLNSVTESLTVDKQLGSVDALKDLALSMQGLSPKNVKFMTVPWTGRGDGENVVWTSAADKIWAAFKNDTPYPPTTTVPAGQKALTVKPSDIRVQVLNGTGVSGKAKSVAAELEKLGFVVVGVGTAKGGTVTTTSVSSTASRAEAARTLAYAAQTSTTDTKATSRTLVLTIGTDWKGVRAVSVASKTPSSVKSADTVTCVS
jgi:LCP family protein required for cell wall assembly